MEYLPNGITLELPDDCFPLSTDSMVLAHFAALPRNAHVLDLGSGCGTLGLMLCAKDPGCTVTGVELEESAHRAALENIHRNALEPHLHSICADLKQVPGLFAPGSFSCCISNPPYFSGGPASSLTTARREDCCSLADLMHSAAWALKYGGDFFLVHRPERLAEIIARGAEKKLEAKRLLLLRHKADGPIVLILLQFRKGGKPGLKIEEQALFDINNLPTDFHNRVYHAESFPASDF
jgi:tRNA1(Val) A37 N6-methylase TrmN6